MLETQMHSQLEFLLICQKRLTLSITISYSYVVWPYNGLNRICTTYHNMLFITACNLQSWFAVDSHKAILGPILFLIYITDITNVSTLLQLLLFADDTNIFLEHMDIEALIATVNSEFVKLAGWFSANRLSPTVSKTNFIIFYSSKKKYNNNLINISLNSHHITQIKHTKFSLCVYRWKAELGLAYQAIINTIIQKYWCNTKVEIIFDNQAVTFGIQLPDFTISCLL